MVSSFGCLLGGSVLLSPRRGYGIVIISSATLGIFSVLVIPHSVHLRRSTLALVITNGVADRYRHKDILQCVCMPFLHRTAVFRCVGNYSLVSDGWPMTGASTLITRSNTHLPTPCWPYSSSHAGRVHSGNIYRALLPRSTLPLVRSCSASRDWQTLR